MQKQLKKAFPKWIDNMKKDKHVLSLSDDLDSLLGCSLLRNYFGLEINQFYDFNKIYEIIPTNKEVIGVDQAIQHGKTFDNHVVAFNYDDYINNESANINAILRINRENYTDKYCMSTALLIYSLYNIPLPSTLEGKRVLLAIDSGYLGFYSDFFKDTYLSYIRQMELDPLIEVLERSTINDFEEVKRKYHLKSKITINENGILKTDIDLSSLESLFLLDLSLPEQPFTLVKTLNKPRKGQVNPNKKYSVKNIKNLYSFALTKKNQYKYTMEE